MDLRQSRPRRSASAPAGLVMRRLVALCTFLLLASGCFASKDEPSRGATPQPVPFDLKAACGRPGAVVELKQTQLPVTVAKSSCDLTGVIIRWKDGKDTVPGGDLADPNGGTDCAADSGVTCPSITVDARTGAVTIKPAA